MRKEKKHRTREEVLAYLTVRGVLVWQSAKIFKEPLAEIEQRLFTPDYKHAREYWSLRRRTSRENATEVAKAKIQAMTSTAADVIADVLYGRLGDEKERIKVALNILDREGLQKPKQLEIKKVTHLSDQPEVVEALKQVAKQLEQVAAHPRTDWSYAYQQPQRAIAGSVRRGDSERGESGQAEENLLREQPVVRPDRDREHGLENGEVRRGPARGSEPMDRQREAPQTGPDASGSPEDEPLDYRVVLTEGDG